MGKHAGAVRIADVGLLDQMKACVAEMDAHLQSPLPTTVEEGNAHRQWRTRWIGRAHWLLEQIGEMGE